MPVNQSDLNFFKEIAGLMKNKKINIDTLRESVKQMDAYVDEPAPVVYNDIRISARDEYQLRLRVYQYDKQIRPAIIFFPGNGFIYDLFIENHAIISKIAKHAECHAIMVDYRLAPENPYPKPLEDAMDAVSYVFEKAKSLIVDKKKIILAGFSSGANLAAVITNQLRHTKQAIFYQLLISGAYDYTDSLHEFDEYIAEDKLLDPKSAKFSFDCYSNKKQRKDPKCSPYWEKDLSKLPPTLIMMGEYDGGRSQGEGYAKKLLDAGNTVEMIIGNGQTHGTILYRKACFDGPDPAVIAGLKLKAVLLL